MQILHDIFIKTKIFAYVSRTKWEKLLSMIDKGTLSAYNVWKVPVHCWLYSCWLLNGLVSYFSRKITPFKYHWEGNLSRNPIGEKQLLNTWIIIQAMWGFYFKIFGCLNFTHPKAYIFSRFWWRLAQTTGDSICQRQ